MTEAVTEPVALTAPPAGAVPLPGLRVLCVDDNIDAADSLGTILTMVGCDARVAHDGAAALALAEQFDAQICILDITLKETWFDGCELARRLRARPGSEGQLLVALTALGDYKALERMADSGFDLHFTKPVAPADLYAMLSRFAEHGRPR